MSNKNLLNEATIRRFMKLADMEPLTSPFVDRLDEMHCPSGGRDDDEPMEEAAHEDDEPGARDYMEEADDAEKLDATERELGDMDAEADRERDEMDDMEDKMDDMEADDADMPAEIRDRIEDALAAALEDLADKLDLDLDVEREDDDAPEMMDAAPEAEVEIDVDDDDDAVEVDAMLENVEVVDDTDLINEVAKRVTARLVKAMAKK